VVVTEPGTPSEASLNRAVKRIEWWPLLRGIVPLIAVSASLCVIYLVLGLSSDQDQVLYGVPLLAAGCACAVVGFRRRLGEMRTSDDPTTRGYGLIFLGWALTVVGLLLPWYVVA
jgi:hypothetical protein